MSKIYERLDGSLIEFIKQQKIFFVATAPLSDQGHVNLSPKGYDSFAILDEMTVAWLDLGGSGIETLAHVKENERMTLMFCAFEGPANILRLYGRARAIQFDMPDFPKYLKYFPGYDNARAIFVVTLDRIADACGWGVPFYQFIEERAQLKRFKDNPEESADFWAERYYTRNSESIDGLPGIESPTGANPSKR